MGITEILGIIGLFLLYASAMITAWIKLNVKIKELDMKIVELRNNQSSVDVKIKTIEDISRGDHQILNEKLDKIFKLLTILSTEHNFMKCSYVEKNINKNEKNGTEYNY